MIPIRRKTTKTHSFNDIITEIPNVLSDEHIDRLKEYALSEESGLHRRGSKESETTASFFTCQVFRHDDILYEILNPIWETYLEKHPYTISFIEPYEIKSYVAGDQFERHVDTFIDVDNGVYRKINLIIQMSDETEYQGGDFRVGAFKCTKTKGSAIMFDATMPHEVKPIISGTRFSLIGHAWSPIYK